MTTLALAAAAYRAGDTSRAEQIVHLARAAAGRPSINAPRLDLDDLDHYRRAGERAVSGMVLLMRMLDDATAVIAPVPWLREAAPYYAVDLATNLGAHGLGHLGDLGGDEVIVYETRRCPGLGSAA